MCACTLLLLSDFHYHSAKHAKNRSEVCWFGTMVLGVMGSGRGLWFGLAKYILL